MKLFPFIIILCIGCSITAQSDMDVLLEKHNKETVPYIYVQELKTNLHNYLLLDTRKKKEYDVSHIPGAIWVSEKLNKSDYVFTDIKKDQPIVVYCSVGVRSEDFGEDLKKQGFTNVQNLYGSIFAWKDNGYKIVNSNKEETDNVHVYSKEWGEYLKTGTKVY